MKNARVITMALLAVAGGVTGAAAQGAGPYYNVNAMDYPLHEQFTNAPRFAYTANLPALTSTDLESLSGAAYTDGSGRIAGLVYARVYFGGPNNHSNNYGAFTVTVTGTTSSRGTNPLVKFTMRGNGYSFDGVSNHPNATLSLKFTSTNKLVDMPSTQVTVTNPNYSVTFADGSTQVFSNGPATKTNSAFSFLSGPIRGNIQPGRKSPVNGGHSVRIDETAALLTADSNWFVVNGTNFVETTFGGGLIVDVLTNIDAQVIQPVPGSRLFLNAYVGSRMDLYSATGTANTNSGKWSAHFSGVAFARGSTLQANGTLGPAIVAYEPIPGTTNFVSQVVPNAIQQMTILSGKLFGQRVVQAPSAQIQGVNVPPTPPGPPSLIP